MWPYNEVRNKCALPIGGIPNARLLVEAGGAVVIPSNEFSPMRLVDQIIGLLSRGPGPAAMGLAARSLARPRAAADIADHLEELGGAR